MKWHKPLDSLAAAFQSSFILSTASTFLEKVFLRSHYYLQLPEK